MTTGKGRNQPGTIGQVVRKNPGSYIVSMDGKRSVCFMSGIVIEQHLRETGRHNSQAKTAEIDDGTIALGDQVRVQMTGDGTGIIHEVLPRRSKYSRRGTIEHPYEQVIAANLDQVITVLSVARPEPKWNLLDRYLVTASLSDIPAVICITKTDLLKPGNRPAELDMYARLGYPVLETSAASGAGIASLRQALNGRFSVLIGKSGVGKTSLLNALQPGLGLRVGNVSQESGKGIHTTTALEMFALDNGGSILDTPGTREFGLLDVVEDDLANHFPEIKPHIGNCRFGLSCRHHREPGCKVIEAVQHGLISVRRFDSYHKLVLETSGTG